MISWLQTVIQRNNKFLFSLLLIVIIIAFVFTIGDFGGVGPGSRDDRLAAQEFYGYDLNNRRTVEELSRSANISMFLNGQPRPSTQEQATMLILQRVIGLYLADQFQIPATPSREAFTRFFQDVPAFSDPQTGVYSRNRSQQIMDDFNNDPQLGDALLTLVLVEDYRIDKAMQLLGGPGYVLPQVAETALLGRKTEWTLEIASLSRAQAKPELDLSDATLEAYYEANKERYRPENEIVAGYALVASDAAAAGEPSQAELEAFYQAHSADWAKGENGEPKPLADVRAQVAQAWQQDKATEAAEHAANQLTLEIYNAVNSGKLKPEAASLEAFLAGKNLKFASLPPFNSSSLLQPGAGQEQIKRGALALIGQDRFFSDAVAVDDGAAIVFLLDQVELPVPALATIREQVSADASAEQSLRFFAEKTQSDRAALEKALSEGKSFEDAAQALGLHVRKIAPFTFETLPEDINPYFLFAAIELQKGQISQPLTDAEGNNFVYLAERKLPQGEADATELEQVSQRLQQDLRFATISSVLSEMANLGEEQEAQAAAY